MPTSIEMNPGLALLLNLLSGGTGTSTAGAATGGTSGTPQVQELEDLLDGIPIANDGDVITAEHHNSLRSAIGLIARAVRVEELAKVQTLTFPPVLLPEVGQNQWRIDVGIARGPDVGATDQTDAYGWMPIDLPQGARMESMTVRGRRQGTVGTWAVSLVRREIASADQANVFYTELQDLAEGTFSKNVPIVTPEDTGLTASQIEDLRLVDNSRYRYLFYTAMDGAAAGGDISLSDVQVTLGRS